ncbi:MAG: HAMP domain-containing histidine kinase [Chloroflexota bacterium]|nr:HAMP domain-containing histidine kinase [Chloroflexota bacterium]
MEAQLEELQDAARLRAGHPLELRSQSVDLVALVEEAVAEAQRTTSWHAVRLEVPNGELRGQWDPLRLRRVLDNLLSNALKYSEGGEVVVTVREEQRDGRRVVLAVRDEGVGIPAADLPHVFDRYRRGSNVGRRTPGTGIGLSGACQIVRQHGGTISVASEEGRGSTFTVELPLDPQG